MVPLVYVSKNMRFMSDCIATENGGNPDAAAASRNGVADGELEVNLVNSHTNGNSNSCSTEEKSSTEENDLHER